MTLKIEVLAWNMHKIVAGLIQLMGSKLFPSDNYFSKDNTDLHIQKKLHKIRLMSKRPQTITKMNDNIIVFVGNQNIYVINLLGSMN